MSDKKTNKIKVAVDDGYAEIKIVHELREAAFVSPLYAEEVSYNNLLDNKFGIYRIENKYFSVRPYSGKEKLLGQGSGNSHYSLENLAIIHHGLVLSGLQGQKIGLACGLPLGQYFNITADGLEINNDSIAKKINILKKPVEYLDPSTQPNVIVDADIIPQSFPVISKILETFGDREIMLHDGYITLVDIGGGTTDISTFKVIDNEINSVNSLQSTTLNIGVDRVVDRTIEFHKNLTKENLSNLRGFIHKAIRSQKMVIKNGLQTHDFTESYNKSVPIIKNEILEKLVEINSKSSHENIYIFIGGGSKVFNFKEDMENNGMNMVQLSEIDSGLDPQLLNVMMFYKFYGM